MESNSLYVFTGKGHSQLLWSEELSNFLIIRGDLMVSLCEVPHALFKREKMDLFLEYRLPVWEALTGLNFRVVLIDGIEVRIVSEDGDKVVQNGEVKVLWGKGMKVVSKYKRKESVGNLYIRFHIEMPDAKLYPLNLFTAFHQFDKAEKTDSKCLEITLSHPSPDFQFPQSFSSSM
eukprot:TRINITY_DN12684_c0_g3_i6.p2 TRINITY_DN12684_c0_g3~~TRINITY_DN12684_c0_g3_i6.p2  ORF type:complete len:176 (-),score=31.76 TRINITY_DN12684_c0_g3_i6:32-559(-)